MHCTATVENAYEHVADGDLKPLFDMLAPAVIWTEAESTPYSAGGTLLGPDAVQTEMVDRLVKDSSDFHANVTRVIGTGATVLVQGRRLRTKSTEGMLEAIFAHVYAFDEDKPCCSSTTATHGRAVTYSNMGA
jgi:ketosteroid isomerase-like protein